MTKPLRDTKQRAAIKRTIEETGRPLGSKEILQQASRYVPQLGIATVYRNLKLMVEQGDLATVEVPGQAARYCVPGDQGRPLFVDTATDRVFPITMDEEQIKSLAPAGMAVERAQLFFFGLASEQAPGLLEGEGSNGNGPQMRSA